MIKNAGSDHIQMKNVDSRKVESLDEVVVTTAGQSLSFSY